MRRHFPAAVLYIVLALCALAVIYPVLYAISTSLMTPGEARTYPPHLVPHNVYLRNFVDVFSLVPIAAFIGNTFLVSGIVMLGQLVTSSMAAYAFARMNFKGKSLLFAMFMATMMIPWEVTIIPNYLTVRGWGWLDSYQGLIVPFLAASFGTFLLRQFFMQLPTELFEAARMDGCGHVRFFLSHVIPLSRPALGTLAVYSFLNMWNAYLWPLLITNKDKMRTVQIGVSMLQHQETTAWNLVFAGIVLVILPSLLMLMLGLKQLVRGMTVGALKG